MFSKEMEALIEATLQDGMLTDQEKAVLVKRAQKEGIDVDELDVYIQSLLQKRQQEQIEKRNQQEEELEKEKAKAIGPICPKCHKQVPPLTLVCDCGYEFTKKKDVSSVQLLFEKINDIQLTEAEIDSCSSTVEEGVGFNVRKVYDADGNVAKKVNQQDLEKLILKKKLEIIKTFPVPNTKEDIIEFLVLSLPNAQTKGGLLGTRKGRILIVLAVIIIVACILGILGLVGIIEEGVGLLIGGDVFFGITLGSVFVAEFDEETLHHNDAAVVWKAKFDQVLLKGRSLRTDPEFTQKLDYYENLLNSNEKTTGGMMDNLNVDYKKVGKILLFILGGFIVLFLLVKLFSGTSKDNNENSDIDNVENIINGAYNDNIGETDDTENVSGGASDASDEMLKAREQAAEQMRKAREQAAEQIRKAREQADEQMRKAREQADEQMRKAQEEMRKAMGQ